MYTANASLNLSRLAVAASFARNEEELLRKWKSTIFHNITYTTYRAVADLGVTLNRSWRIKLRAGM